MTLTQLRYFCEIAELKSFSLASRKLYVAQSSISYAIRELERELGVPLFIRGKSVELTMYGNLLLPYVTNSLASLDRGLSEVLSVNNPPYKVKIGAFVNTTYFMIPWFLKDFSEKNPNSNINIDLCVQYSAFIDMFSPLARGDYDLIITGCEEQMPNCVSKQIAIQPIKLLVHKDNKKFKDKKSVTFADFKDEIIHCVHQYSYMDRYLQNMFKSAGISPPKMEYINDISTLLSTVSIRNGFGITTHVTVDDDVLRLIDIDEPTAVRKIFISWPTNRHVSDSAKVVLKHFLQVSEDYGCEKLSF